MKYDRLKKIEDETIISLRKGLTKKEIINKLLDKKSLKSLFILILKFTIQIHLCSFYHLVKCTLMKSILTLDH